MLYIIAFFCILSCFVFFLFFFMFHMYFVYLIFYLLNYPSRLTLNSLHKIFILNPCLLSLLIVWYSASYLVCLTSTLFPLLSTFLGRHFLLLNIHYALLMQQFQFLTFL